MTNALENDIQITESRGDVSVEVVFGYSETHGHEQPPTDADHENALSQSENGHASQKSNKEPRLKRSERLKKSK